MPTVLEAPARTARSSVAPGEVGAGRRGRWADRQLAAHPHVMRGWNSSVSYCNALEFRYETRKAGRSFTAPALPARPAHICACRLVCNGSGPAHSPNHTRRTRIRIPFFRIACAGFHRVFTLTGGDTRGDYPSSSVALVKVPKHGSSQRVFPRHTLERAG
jgi:hypothetical protein